MGRSLKNAFDIVMCLSNASYSVFETNGEIAAVLKEAKQNAQIPNALSMMCMFALATVIGCAIHSYFPVTDDSATSQNWDTLAKMFNCSINPRQHVDGDVHECVHIFRCVAMLQRYLVDRVIPDRKNHFVALCHLSTNLEPG